MGRPGAPGRGAALSLDIVPDAACGWRRFRAHNGMVGPVRSVPRKGLNAQHGGRVGWGPMIAPWTRCVRPAPGQASQDRWRHLGPSTKSPPIALVGAKRGIRRPSPATIRCQRPGPRCLAAPNLRRSTSGYNLRPAHAGAHHRPGGARASEAPCRPVESLRVSTHRWSWPSHRAGKVRPS